MLTTIAWTLPRLSDSRYPGSFPLHFEDNLVKILGNPDRILQPFGGRATVGVRCDIKPELEPDVVADAHALPFEDGSFDCVILDPPYSKKEAVRVLRDREPSRPARCNTMLRIVITLRPHHRPRVAMIYQKRKPGMLHYGTEFGEEGYGS